MRKITVKNSGIIKLQSFDDFPNGKLFIGQVGEHIPFDIKRFYIITNLFNDKQIRGKHAHKTLEQYIFCLRGNCILGLDDGVKKQDILLNNSMYGIRIGPSLWHIMKKFSKDCMLLVVASNLYDENDYIRNYDKFIEHIDKTKK